MTVSSNLLSVDLDVAAYQMAARKAVTDIASFGLPIGDEWHDVTPPTSNDPVESIICAEEAEDLSDAVAFLYRLGLLEKRSSDGAVKILFGKKYPGGKL